MTFDYEQSIWGRGEAVLAWSNPASFRLSQALKILSSDKSKLMVMEIGCGAGQFIRSIKKLRPGLDCFGCDISRSAIALAKSYKDGVDYQLSEEKKLPYTDGSVDAILIFDVLEHVEDPAAIIKEMHRVLKKDGQAYCFVPCEGDYLSLWHAVRTLGFMGDLTKKYAGHINYFSRQSLLNLFQENKFFVEKVNYGEHILGQLVNLGAYLAMDSLAKKRGLAQINNETFFTKKEVRKSALRRIKDLVNSLVYMESFLGQKIPSPNVHVWLKKI